MFSCSDRHPKIWHEAYHCPLCEALEDLEYALQTDCQGSTLELESLRQRKTEGGC